MPPPPRGFMPRAAQRSIAASPLCATGIPCLERHAAREALRASSTGDRCPGPPRSHHPPSPRRPMPRPRPRPQPGGGSSGPKPSGPKPSGPKSSSGPPHGAPRPHGIIPRPPRPPRPIIGPPRPPNRRKAPLASTSLRAMSNIPPMPRGGPRGGPSPAIVCAREPSSAPTGIPCFICHFARDRARRSDAAERGPPP